MHTSHKEMLDDTAFPDLHPDQQKRLNQKLLQWSGWIKNAGLEHFIGALLDAAEPLGPLAAQLLWVAEPMVGLLSASTGISDEINGLARVLDAPDGVAWLRAELLEQGDFAGTSDKEED